LADGGDDRSGRIPGPTLDELFERAAPSRDTPRESATDARDRPADAPDGSNAEELDLTASEKSDEIRDLALAAETSRSEDDGCEVTSPPSDADQDETARIVTEAVEAGSSPQEIEASEAGAGRNVPPLPPTEPFSTDRVEGSDSEMHQP
jgi:N utilization substance protein A